MRTSIKYPTKTEAVISIVAASEELNLVKQNVLRKLNSNQLKIAGFRPGHAPLHLVEKHLDTERLQTEFLQDAINKLYRLAVEQHKLRPVSQPEVSVKKFVPFDTLEIELKLEVVGDFIVPDYRKIKNTKPAVNVTSDDVTAVIKSLQTRMAEKKEVTRAAKQNDEVLIDFKGTDSKKQPVKGADGVDYPLALGSNTFIPGFEAHIIGLKAGQNKTFTLKFPKDYGVSALQNRNVTFDVTVKKVHAVTLPKADDNFASKVGPFKTLSDLKKDIKTQLTIERQAEVDRQFEQDILESLAAKLKVELPNTLVDEHIDRLEQRERQNLVYKGQTWQEHLKDEGVTEEEHRAKQKPQAELNIKISLLLDAIAEQENITASEQEANERIAQLRAQYKDQKMQAELEKPESKIDIALRIRSEKTLAHIVKSANK